MKKLITHTLKNISHIIQYYCSHVPTAVKILYSGLLDYEHDVYFTEISFYSTGMRIWIVLYRKPLFKML